MNARIAIISKFIGKISMNASWEMSRMLVMRKIGCKKLQGNLFAF